MTPCEQALEAQKTATSNRCYYDWKDQLATNPAGNVPYTPVLPLLYGLQESLALLNAEGIDNVIARHDRCRQQGGVGAMYLGCHTACVHACCYTAPELMLL